jgi:hypothetical protein
MTSVHLHQRLMQALGQLGLGISQPQQVNLALWCQALAVSSDCHRANLALGLPVEGEREHLI